MANEWVKVTLTGLGATTLRTTFSVQASSAGHIGAIWSAPAGCFAEQVLVRATDQIEGMSVAAKTFPGCNA